jgi:hypothetical protein
MRMRDSTFLVVLMAGAFAVRLGAVAALRDVGTGPARTGSADDVEFNNLALRVAGGEGYVGDEGLPTSFRAPGWPLFLAAVYLPHVYFSTLYLSESLFVVCLALAAWLFIVALRRDSAGLLTLAGLALGWATLTRPFALLLWPVLLAVLVLDRRRRGRPLVVPALALTASFAACLLPWTIRNHQVHGRFVLVATNGGSTFYGGNNDRVAGELRQLGSWISTTELPHRDLIEATDSEVAHDQVEWRLGLGWVREHPGRAALLCIFKAARLCLWLPDFDGGSWRMYAVRIVGYVPFLLLMAWGMIACLRQRACRAPAWLVVHGGMLATLATALVFWGSPRFRDADLPFLMVYAALGLGQLRERAARPRHLDRCLVPYLLAAPRRRRPRPGEEVHLLLCVADHYEPKAGATEEVSRARVGRWIHDYPRRLGHFRDSDGRPPRHTFFYPVEEYEPAYLDALADLCRRGFGEVEVHLHHDGDTAENLRATLEEFKATLAGRHGLLARHRLTGEVMYGFVHGNWALDNSRPDGRWCGVDNELSVLVETGCYADFTLPSAPSPAQTRTINSIYYAAGGTAPHPGAAAAELAPPQVWPAAAPGERLSARESAGPHRPARPVAEGASAGAGPARLVLRQAAHPRRR